MTYHLPSNIELFQFVLKNRGMPENPTTPGCIRYLEQHLKMALELIESFPPHDSQYYTHLKYLILYVGFERSQAESELKTCFDAQLQLLKLDQIL